MIRREDAENGVKLWIGEHLLVIFTNDTDAEAIARFITLASAMDELPAVCAAYESGVKFNQDNPSASRSWPAFNQKERLMRILLAKAGIIDT